MSDKAVKVPTSVNMLAYIAGAICLYAAFISWDNAGWFVPPGTSPMGPPADIHRLYWSIPLLLTSHFPYMLLAIVAAFLLLYHVFFIRLGKHATETVGDSNGLT